MQAFYLDIETVLIFLVIMTIFVLLFLIVLIIRVGKISSSSKNMADEEKLLREQIGEELGKAAENSAKALAHDSQQRLESEIKKFSEELAHLLHAKSSELTAYIGKAQQDQVRESQFFVANMLSKIEKDAEEYRKNKLTQVDEQIRQIVMSAAREVIGRSISLTEHEDLVTKALEKAKKDRVFT